MNSHLGVIRTSGEGVANPRAYILSEFKLGNLKRVKKSVC